MAPNLAALQSNEKWYTEWVVTPCCFLNCVFLGPFYAWSVMVDPLNEAIGGNNGSYIISVVIFLSSLANVAMGRYVDRLGPRKCVLMGLVITCLGLLLGGLSVRHKSLALFYLGFGGLCGAGIGWAFLASLLMMIKWYHRAGRPGLAAGIFGLCIGSASTIFTYVDYALLDNFSVENVFYLLAVIIALAPVPSLLFFDFPPAAPAPSTASAPAPAAAPPKPLAMSEVLQRPVFWQFFVANMLLLTPGWGVKVLVLPIQEDLFDVDRRVATNIAAVFLASYSVGRAAFSMLADRVHVAKIFVAFPLMNVAIFLALPLILGAGDSNEAIFNVLTCVAGVVFAGAKSLFSVYLLKIWGPANLSQVTGLSLPSYGLAAVIGPVSAVKIAESSDVVNDTDVYNAWFIVMALANVASLLLMVQLGVRVSRAAPGGASALPSAPRKSESELARPSLSLATPLLDDLDTEDDEEHEAVV